MENNICELLEQMSCIKEEQKKIVSNMGTLRREYEESFKVLQQQYQDSSNRMTEIGKCEFPVRLGDLIEEICWLSSTKPEEISVSISGNISLNGVHTLNDILEFIGNMAKCDMHFRISNRDKSTNDMASSFNYTNPLIFDLNSIQADGKTLLEHCSVVVMKRIGSGEEYTEFVINKDINEVILPLTLNYVSLSTSFNWIPADLFTQAVINSVEKYKSNSKTLRRTKDSE